MKKVLCFLLFLFSISFFFGEMRDSNRLKIDQYKIKYSFFTDFLKDHSEKKLFVVMKFCDNPEKHICKVKRYADLFRYFEILDRISALENPSELSWFELFLKNQFIIYKLNEKRIEILTILLLKSAGYFGEELSDLYTKLFFKHSDIFIKYLSKRSDWKRIVNSLEAGDWEIFINAALKLKDNGFEGEFKKFVINYPKENK